MSGLRLNDYSLVVQAAIGGQGIAFGVDAHSGICDEARPARQSLRLAVGYWPVILCRDVKNGHNLRRCRNDCAWILNEGVAAPDSSRSVKGISQSNSRRSLTQAIRTLTALQSSITFY